MPLVFTDLWSSVASYDDWDWNIETTRSLNSARYISSPYSLRLAKPGAPDWDNTFLLCRKAATLLIPDGRIQTWYYTDSTYYWWKWLIFRSQIPLGSADLASGYYIGLSGQQMQYTDGYGTTFRTVDLSLPLNTWHHIRVTWESGLIDSIHCLNIQVERESGSEWVACDDLVQRVPELYKDSSINRVGIGCNAHHLVPEHFDNTEVYKKGAAFARGLVIP